MNEKRLAEKRFGIIILFLSIFSALCYLFLILPIYNSVNNSAISFNELRIPNSDIHLLMTCRSNTDFIVAQQSNIKCYLRAYSEEKGYGTASISIHAYDSKSVINTIWWCNAFIIGINNKTVSNEVICSNDVIVPNDIFKPVEAINAKFGLSSFVAESISPPGYKIEYSGQLESISQPIEFFSPDMRVLSKEEFIDKEVQKSNLLLSLTVALFASIALILQIVVPYFSIWKKRDDIDEEQRELLGSIKVWVKLVSESVKGQRKMLSKRGRFVPHWIIPEIDSSFFITRLKHSINNHKTSALKELIIRADSKAKDINNALNFVKISDISQNRKSTDAILEMIREKKYQFHSHLIQLTKEIEKELKTIEGDSMKKKFLEKQENRNALHIALFASLILLLAQIGGLAIQWSLEFLAGVNILPLNEKMFIATGYCIMAIILAYFISKTEGKTQRK